MAASSSSGGSASTATASANGGQPNGGNSSLTGSPYQSGHLPTIADVRSPDVLHPHNGPCDCLSHPMPVSWIIVGLPPITDIDDGLGLFLFAAIAEHGITQCRNEKPRGPDERPQQNLVSFSEDLRLLKINARIYLLSSPQYHRCVLFR